MVDLNNLAIRVETPCRVDLAGGTLDLAPLSTFEAPVVTVNAAVDIMSRADLRVRTDGKIVIRSEDRGHEVRFDNLRELMDSAGTETPLDLLVNTIRYWSPPTGLALTTYTEAPPGSGIGASSSVLVAVLGALTTMFGGRYGRQEVINDYRLIGRAATLEARHLLVPTGTQDHFAALYGGPLSIRYEIDGAFPEKLALRASTHDFLNSHLLVLYTGKPHTSATPNWSIVKRYIDGDGETRERLRSIKRIAADMLAALKGDDQDGVARLLKEEWEVRRGLASEVTTPELDQAIASLYDAGALAVKACGAGGGGSIVALARPAQRKAVVAAAEKAGCERLSCRITSVGIRIMQLGPGDVLRPVPSSFGAGTAQAVELPPEGAEAAVALAQPAAVPSEDETSRMEVPFDDGDAAEQAQAAGEPGDSQRAEQGA